VGLPVELPGIRFSLQNVGTLLIYVSEAVPGLGGQLAQIFDPVAEVCRVAVLLDVVDQHCAYVVNIRLDTFEEW
jgi:hypothetical protein